MPAQQPMQKWELLLNHDHSQQRIMLSGTDRGSWMLSTLSHGWVVVAEFEAPDVHAAMVIADAMSPSYRENGALRFYDPRKRN